MNIIGLDNGYNFTKTSKGITICSTIIEGSDSYNGDDVIQVKYNGKNYIVGEARGKYIADADKLKNDANREVLKICTLTSIGMSFPKKKNIKVNLVVGVPVAYFDSQKDELKKLMSQLKEQKIRINQIGAVQTITVEEVLVFPQSVGVVFKYSKKVKNETSLVIDIGGGTWDVSQFSGMKLEDKATYQEGMLVLYDKIATAINEQHYTSFSAYQIYDLIQRGYFTADGERYDMGRIAIPIIEEHIKPIMDTIGRKFDLKSVDNIFLIGGGAVELEQYIKSTYIKNYILEEDAQFSNAKNFELIGKVKFKDNN